MNMINKLKKNKENEKIQENKDNNKITQKKIENNESSNNKNNSNNNNDNDNDIDDDNDNDIDNKEDNNAPTEHSTEKPTTWVDIESEIKNEIAAYDTFQHCRWIKGPISSLIFIYIINPSIDCVDLLRYIFEKPSPVSTLLSPFIFKLFPIQMSCYSTHEGILEVCQKLIPKAFENEPKTQKYAIVVKNRSQNHDNEQRLQLIKNIASLVPQDFKVDLKKKPQIVISVQTFGKAAGVSIIKNEQWLRFRQYALTET